MAQPQKLDLLDRTLLAIARVQPFNRGLLRRFWINFFKKRFDHAVETTYRGVPFLFHLDNTTEQKGLCNFYDVKEVNFAIEASRVEKPIFIDVGANSGLYSQIFLFHASSSARVIAIEPNPEMCERIRANASLLSSQKSQSLIIENYAVGNEEGMMYLSLETGAGGAHLVSEPSSNSIEVKVKRLLDILKAHNVGHIDLLKIDVEGFEDKVLIPFFDRGDRILFPKSIIIEHTSDRNWKGDLWTRLKKEGYEETLRTRGNAILRLHQTK